MRNRSKRYKNLSNSKIKNKKLTAKEILEMVKKNCNTKFDESIDVSLRVNLKDKSIDSTNLEFALDLTVSITFSTELSFLSLFVSRSFLYLFECF